MATLVTILGVLGLPAQDPIRVEELDDAKALTDILSRNGYTFNLQGAN